MVDREAGVVRNATLKNTERIQAATAHVQRSVRDNREVSLRIERSTGVAEARLALVQGCVEGEVTSIQAIMFKALNLW